MAGTAPESSDAPVPPAESTADDGDPAHRDPWVVTPAARRARRGWWAAVLLAVVLVGVVTLVWRPWLDPAAAPVPSTDAVASATVGPTPSPAPPAASSALPAPGADAVFDATTAATLFATSADLQGAVPAAAGGVTRGVEPGAHPWGLPEGATVEPASCTAAITVVSAPPLHHDVSSWVADDLRFDQDVVLLLDAAAARAAFRALVTTVDECPRYTQSVPGVDGATWTADPALEGQGVFPAIVHDVTATVEGDTHEQTTGHLLVGNAILTWTATALDAEDRAQAREALGEPRDLGAMVERRALAAVRGLG